MSGSNTNRRDPKLLANLSEVDFLAVESKGEQVLVKAVTEAELNQFKLIANSRSRSASEKKIFIDVLLKIEGILRIFRDRVFPDFTASYTRSKCKSKLEEAYLDLLLAKAIREGVYGFFNEEQDSLEQRIREIKSTRKFISAAKSLAKVAVDAVDIFLGIDKIPQLLMGDPEYVTFLCLINPRYFSKKQVRDFLSDNPIIENSEDKSFSVISHLESLYNKQEWKICMEANPYLEVYANINDYLRNIPVLADEIVIEELDASAGDRRRNEMMAQAQIGFSPARNQMSAEFNDIPSQDYVPSEIIHQSAQSFQLDNMSSEKCDNTSQQSIPLIEDVSGAAMSERSGAEYHSRQNSRNFSGVGINESMATSIPAPEDYAANEILIQDAIQRTDALPFLVGATDRDHNITRKRKEQQEDFLARHLVKSGNEKDLYFFVIDVCRAEQKEDWQLLNKKLLVDYLFKRKDLLTKLSSVTSEVTLSSLLSRKDDSMCLDKSFLFEAIMQYQSKYALVVSPEKLMKRGDKSEVQFTPEQQKDFANVYMYRSHIKPEKDALRTLEEHRAYAQDLFAKELRSTPAVYLKTIAYLSEVPSSLLNAGQNKKALIKAWADALVTLVKDGTARYRSAIEVQAVTQLLDRRYTIISERSRHTSAQLGMDHILTLLTPAKEAGSEQCFNNNHLKIVFSRRWWGILSADAKKFTGEHLLHLLLYQKSELLTDRILGDTDYIKTLYKFMTEEDLEKIRVIQGDYVWTQLASYKSKLSLRFASASGQNEQDVSSSLNASDSSFELTTGDSEGLGLLSGIKKTPEKKKTKSKSSSENAGQQLLDSAHAFTSSFGSSTSSSKKVQVLRANDVTNNNGASPGTPPLSVSTISNQEQSKAAQVFDQAKKALRTAKRNNSTESTSNNIQMSVRDGSGAVIGEGNLVQVLPTPNANSHSTMNAMLAASSALMSESSQFSTPTKSEDKQQSGGINSDEIQKVMARLSKPAEIPLTHEEPSRMSLGTKVRTVLEQRREKINGTNESDGGYSSGSDQDQESSFVVDVSGSRRNSK